jgi:hypothetical protein
LFFFSSKICDFIISKNICGEQDKGTEPNPGNLLKKMGRKQVITDKSGQHVGKIVLNEFKRLGWLFKPKVTKHNPTEPLEIFSSHPP